MAVFGHLDRLIVHGANPAHIPSVGKAQDRIRNPAPSGNAVYVTIRQFVTVDPDIRPPVPRLEVPELEGWTTLRDFDSGTACRAFSAGFRDSGEEGRNRSSLKRNIQFGETASRLCPMPSRG
jgi:hypothetical protein